MNMITQTELETLLKFSAAPAIVDVRKKPALEKEPAMIQGATWQDYRDAANWADTVRDAGTVVCYCVHGHEVSQSAAAKLRELGISAYYLQGGFEAWQGNSGPLSL